MPDEMREVGWFNLQTELVMFTCSMVLKHLPLDAEDEAKYQRIMNGARFYTIALELQHDALRDLQLLQQAARDMHEDHDDPHHDLRETRHDRDTGDGPGAGGATPQPGDDQDDVQPDGADQPRA